MREILFKAKRIDNGEWVEGNIVLSNDCDDDFEAIIIPRTDSNMFTKHEGFKEISCDLGFENWHKVCVDTLCQYTGLIDKNGNKIWEGDIMRNAGNVVEFCSDGFCINGDSSLSLWTKTEVIGNIFDNPN